MERLHWLKTSPGVCSLWVWRAKADSMARIVFEHTLLPSTPNTGLSLDCLEILGFFLIKGNIRSKQATGHCAIPDSIPCFSHCPLPATGSRHSWQP